MCFLGFGLCGIRLGEGYAATGRQLPALFPEPSFLSLGPHGKPYTHFTGEITEGDGGVEALLKAGFSTSKVSNSRKYK